MILTNLAPLLLGSFAKVRAGLHASGAAVEPPQTPPPLMYTQLFVILTVVWDYPSVFLRVLAATALMSQARPRARKQGPWPPL
jgi:hypothetical protein